MTFKLLGWDVGGAHLKAAVVNQQGRVEQVFQEACPLWQGLDKLEQATQRILSRIDCQINGHALTMTGELVDLFENREQGVLAILQCMEQSLQTQQLLVFAAPDRFLKSSDIKRDDYLHIASANWIASLVYCAQKVENAVFIDIGSTTSDILVINNSVTDIKGYSDYERLCTSEMVYTGIVRTPVMAIAQQIQFEGQAVRLMAEHFATMADVYRLTGELYEPHDQCDSADAGPKTELGSALRLSRMIGCDFYKAELSRWQQFAQTLHQSQIDLLQVAVEIQLKRVTFEQAPVFIGAGIGRFLVRELALLNNYRYIDFDQMFDIEKSMSGITAADCAPAVSVACLALKSSY